MQSLVDAVARNLHPQLPDASCVLAGARSVARGLARSGKRVAAMVGKGAVSQVSGGLTPRMLSSRQGPTASRFCMQGVDPTTEVLLAHDALLTIAEWGWAEAFTIDPLVADSLGASEREVSHH